MQKMHCPMLLQENKTAHLQENSASRLTKGDAASVKIFHIN